jgi:CRISPR-associated protein Cas1
MIKQTINSLEDYKLKVGSAEGVIVADVAPSLRGWEGLSAKKYFKCLSVLLPEPYQFEKRSHNPAADEFNAALNYGYGILYGKIESSLIKAGIDPYVGIFHRDDYNRPALVFDIIEKFRIWIDYVIVQLFLQMAFSDECFVKNETMCYLDGLGKRIVIQSINDYLGEIILLNKLERSRAVHIDLYANSLAQEFLKHN